jgi:hypothetical protein
MIRGPQPSERSDQRPRQLRQPYVRTACTLYIIADAFITYFCQLASSLARRVKQVRNLRPSRCSVFLSVCQQPAAKAEPSSHRLLPHKRTYLDS